MKLENESNFFHSTLSHKPVSKASELVNDAFESDRLKTQSEENCDVNGHDDLDDEVQYMTKDEIFLNPLKEDFSSGHRMDNDDVKVFNVESFEKDSEVYIEQNVPECDLPKLIVCYKENSCNIVKDICVDEGTMPSPLPFRVIFESEEHENDQIDEWTKELQIADIAMDNEFKDSDQSLSEMDLVDQINANELVPSIGVEHDLEDLNAKQIVELDPCDGNFNGDDGVEEDTVQVSSEIENSANSTLVYACEDSVNEAEKSTPTDLYPVSILEEPRDNSIPNDLSYNSKVENESITFNFSSLVSDSNEKTEFPENGANREDRSKSEFGKLSKVEDGTSGRIQLGIGESSFSAVGPLASLVNFSGPVAYSGSLSIRSDSSTTSTRSFAFPMLQADWHHNSPVRMAKADRRFFRKDKGWRLGLFAVDSEWGCSFIFHRYRYHERYVIQIHRLILSSLIT